MLSDDYIHRLPKPLKTLVFTFVMVLSIGYLSGLAFVQETTNASSAGIIENYVGNEDDEDAEEMKFKKSYHEMLNIIHTHVLSMSIIFFLLGLLVYGVQMNAKLKMFLLIEPLLSVVLTFGSIYLIWSGMHVFSYVAMVSGGLMTFSFVASACAIFYALCAK
ncbi:MAG: hypothetical protein AAGA77_22150 [Bacteroidota bacterium]